MANNKKKNLTPVQQEYQQLQTQLETKRPVLLNCIKAFITGGIICLFGQFIQNFYIHYFDFTDQTAGNPTAGTLIFIAMLLTGFGVYDRIAQFGEQDLQYHLQDSGMLLYQPPLNIEQKDLF